MEEGFKNETRSKARRERRLSNAGALIVRIGFWGIF